MKSNVNHYLPAAKSSDTITVSSLNLYALVPCVESIHRILEAKRMYTSAAEILTETLARMLHCYCRYCASTTCCYLKKRTGLNSSCCSSATASFITDAWWWSGLALMALMFKICHLVTRCFLLTFSENDFYEYGERCLHGNLNTVNLIVSNNHACF